MGEFDDTQIGRDGKRYPVGNVPALTDEDIHGSTVRVYGTPGAKKSIQWVDGRATWTTASGGGGGGLNFGSSQTYTFVDADLSDPGSWYGEVFVKLIMWTPEVSGTLHLLPLPESDDPDGNHEIDVWQGDIANTDYPDLTAASSSFQAWNSITGRAKNSSTVPTSDFVLSPDSNPTMTVVAGQSYAISLTNWDSNNAVPVIHLDRLYAALAPFGGLAFDAPAPPFELPYNWVATALTDGRLAVKPVWGDLPPVVRIQDATDLQPLDGNDSRFGGLVTWNGQQFSVTDDPQRRSSFSISSFDVSVLHTYTTGSGAVAVTDSGSVTLSKGGTATSAATVRDKRPLTVPFPEHVQFWAEIAIPAIDTSTAQWQFDIVFGNAGSDIFDGSAGPNFGFRFLRNGSGLHGGPTVNHLQNGFNFADLGSVYFDPAGAWAEANLVSPINNTVPLFAEVCVVPGIDVEHMEYNVRYCYGQQKWTNLALSSVPIPRNVFLMNGRWAAYLSATSGTDDISVEIQSVGWSYRQRS